MSLYTWMLEHHPEARMNRVVHDMQMSHGGISGFKSFGHETRGFVTDVATIGLAVYSRGLSLVGQKTQLDAVLGQGIFYDPGVVDPSSYPYYVRNYSRRSIKSPRQDTLKEPGSLRVPKTRGGTKSSRAAGAAQTLKPFWSNGKPKCRKGYRYDFKRKMCVRKS